MTNFDHPILDDYSQTVPGDTPLNLITVGTYKKEGIGQSCYHSDLFVAENILSHSLPQKNDWIVCDMVAGTDAFAYSLHVQFDAIMLIAEPTPESVEVCKLFMNLAREAHVESIIHIIGNKIEADDDLEFIEEKLGIKPIAYVPSMRALKKLRQTERPIHELDMTHDITEAMKTIENITFETPLDDAKRMDMLIELHKKLYLKPWVNTFYGNVLEQIDPNFTLTTHMKKEAA